MALYSILVVALCLAALAALSIRASKRLARHHRLPMQWGLDGQPTWRAPRALALAFTPILAALVLTPTAAMLAAVPEGAGASGSYGMIVLMVMAAALIGAHLLHLWLLRRWDRAQTGAGAA